jgi:hypothetical protein
MYFLDRAAFALDPTQTGCDEQRLPKRMRMPGRARAWLEGDTTGADSGGIGRLKKWIDPNRSREILGRRLARRLRTASLNLHGFAPVE